MFGLPAQLAGEGQRIAHIVSIGPDPDQLRLQELASG